MSKYTSSIFVAVPIDLLGTAEPIAQAFDPDTGGRNGFKVIRATKDGVTYAICSTPATEQTANGLNYFMTTPGALHQFVANDFATRWPEQVCPTLEECEEFRTNIVLQTGLSFVDALAASGMTYIPAE